MTNRPPETSQTGTENWGISTELSTVLAVLVAFATAASFSYRLGFFAAIDIKLLQFLTLSDIIPSSAHFVGWALFFPVVGLALGRFWVSNSGKDNSGSKSTSRSWKWFKPICVLVGLLALLGLFTTKPFYWASLFSSGVGLFGFLWIIHNHFKPIGPMSSNLLRVIFSIAPICLMVFFAGGLAGEFALSKEKPDVSIMLLTGKSAIGVLIWTSSETVFIRDDNRKIKLIPREQIADVEFYGVNSWTPFFSLPEAWRNNSDAVPVFH